MKLLQFIGEYFQIKIERILNRKKSSVLSLSIVQFTNESWLDGIIRQGRLDEHTFHYAVDNSQQA